MLIFIIVFYIINIAGLIITDKPYTPEMELYKQEYLYYLDKVFGECTPQKDSFLENEAKAIANAKVAVEKLYNNYYDGKISEENFNTEYKQLEAILKNEMGFEEIYKQYIYVRENKNNRYFLYTNGWNGLLSNDDPELLLIFAVLLLVTPVFCNEYNCEMNTIALTTKNGEKNYCFYKLMYVVFIISILCVTTCVLKYFFYNIKYGLKGGNFPLQSLPFFGTSTKKLTLLGAFFVISAFKLYGFLFYAILILFISVLAKKYAPTVFFSTAIIFVPYLGFDMNLNQKFCVPLSFMLGTGLLKGNQYEKSFYGDEMKIIFKEINAIAFVLLIFITFSLCLLMIGIVIINNRNKWSSPALCFWINRTSIMVLICFLLIAVSSSCSEIDEKDSCVYNTYTRMSYETADFRYYVDESDLQNIRLVFENKKSGEKKDLVRNPIDASTREKRFIFGKYPYVYYMKYDIDKSKEWYRGGLENVIAIVELDTNTFSERIIFEKKCINRISDDILGLSEANRWEASFLLGSDAFFLDENYIYFVEKDIKQVNRKTKKIRVIDVPTNKNIAFDGKYIYYIDDKLILSRYDTLSGSHDSMPNIRTPFFLLVEKGILFINRIDNNKMYFADAEGKNLKLISDVSADWFTVDENCIYPEGKVENCIKWDY